MAESLDIISRQQMFDVFARLHDEEQVSVRFVLQKIMRLPAAEILQSGTWREITDSDNDGWFARHFECSICKTKNTYGPSDFCPWCGADMRD